MITDNMREWTHWCDQDGAYGTGIVSLTVESIEREADAIEDAVDQIIQDYEIRYLRLLGLLREADDDIITYPKELRP